jgi:hypothetical protein
VLEIWSGVLLSQDLSDEREMTLIHGRIRPGLPDKIAYRKRSPDIDDDPRNEEERVSAPFYRIVMVVICDYHLAHYEKARDYKD